MAKCSPRVLSKLRVGSLAFHCSHSREDLYGQKKIKRKRKNIEQDKSKKKEKEEKRKKKSKYVEEDRK